MSYKQVIDILAGAKKTIESLLPHPQDEHNRLKITSDLERNIKYVSLLTNTPSVHDEAPVVLGPAKTIGGKKISVNQKVKLSDLEPNEQKVNVLRGKVEESYGRFLKMETLHIKNEFKDNVIRGVAKKAMMKVNKEDPETITLEFIEEIKENIREQARRTAKNEELKLKTQQTAADPNLEGFDFDSKEALAELTKNKGETENGQVEKHEEKVGPITQEPAPEEHEVKKVVPNVTKTPPEEDKKKKK